MAGLERGKGLTRRDFMKLVGVGGIAATGIDATAAGAASKQGESKTTSIPKRALGKTGVEVSLLSLGGMFDTINNQLLLRQAFNWGVTYWDTAEAYGNGLSEEGFGRFFSRYPELRKEIFLVTKSRGTPEKLSEKLDKSLKKLRTDYVDMFFVHGVADFNDIAEPVRQWASQIKKTGKIKLFGFSTHTNMEDCLLAAAKSSWIDGIMFSYNFRVMNSQKMKDAVAACVNTGIGLVAMKTQGGGPVKAETEAELRMVWENPNIASICSQMPNLTILAANVAAARDLKALAARDSRLLDRFALETRSSYCAGCGRICQAGVGGAVPVSDVMRCLMYYRDYGDSGLAREVYAALAKETDAQLSAVDYSRAEKACPQGLAIGELMREASRLLG
jgi:predicted aldo/keto reductase-like oxidoreductase